MYEKWKQRLEHVEVGVEVPSKDWFPNKQEVTHSELPTYQSILVSRQYGTELMIGLAQR